MWLGVYAGAFTGTVREQISEAVAAGFETIELRGQVDGVPLGQLPAETLAGLVAAGRDEGLRVSTLALGTLQRSAADLDGLRHVSELAATHGCRVRLFSTSRPQRLPHGETYPEPPADAWSVETAALAACAAARDEVDPTVPLMLEAEPDSLANTIARQARLIAEAGVERVGYNWDLVNCWMGGEYPWPEPWERFDGRLYGVHYKGAVGRPTDPRRYLGQALPLADDLPHAAIWAALAASGFAGPVTVDPHYPLFAPHARFVPEPPGANAEVCRRTVAVMRQLRDAATARLAADRT